MKTIIARSLILSIGLVFINVAVATPPTSCKLGDLTDEDTDGWGYENGESCLVTDSKYDEYFQVPKELTWEDLSTMTLSCVSERGLKSSYRIGMITTDPISFIGTISRENPFPPKESGHDVGFFYGDEYNKSNLHGAVQIHYPYGGGWSEAKGGYNRHYFRYLEDGSIRYDNVLSYEYRAPYYHQFKQRTYICTSI